MPGSLLNALWIVPILGVLILVHELGHFFAARLVGIRVEEFGIGFPPRLFGHKAKSGVLYSVNLLPIGGFVKMYGQDDLRPDGGVAYGPDSFVAKTPLQRAFVLVAGVLMNLLLAILIFTAIALGQTRDGVYIDQVTAGSPAAAAGWRAGDRLVAIAGREVAGVETLQDATREYAGRELPVTVEREGRRLDTTVVPRANPPEGQGRVGIAPREYSRVPPRQAPLEGVRDTANLLGLMAGGLWQLFSGQANLRDLAGPIGMGQLTGEIVESSRATTIPLWMTLGNFAALLSLNLFLLNLLPLPALDGGRLVFVILEVLRGGRKIAPERENMVHFIGILLLFGLMFAIGFLDISRLVRGDSFLP